MVNFQRHFTRDSLNVPDAPVKAFLWLAYCGFRNHSEIIKLESEVRRSGDAGQGPAFYYAAWSPLRASVCFRLPDELVMTELEANDQDRPEFISYGFHWSS